jgi:hypothetical protein
MEDDTRWFSDMLEVLVELACPMQAYRLVKKLLCPTLGVVFH